MTEWATSPEDCDHVRKTMLGAAYFGGRRVVIAQKSGRLMLGWIVSTKLDSDTDEKELPPTKIRGEIYVLPDIGKITVLQALDVESINPA